MANKPKQEVGKRNDDCNLRINYKIIVEDLSHKEGAPFKY